MKIRDGDFESNLITVTRIIDRMAKSSGEVRLFCFPELCFTGPDIDNIERNAAELPQRIRRHISAAARKSSCWIAPGTFYNRTEKGVTNRLEVFNPRGEIVAEYDKMYPWEPHETSVPGDHISTFRIPTVTTIGISICYDMWFPEQIRPMILDGAEIILHPGLTSTADRKQELILSQAHAIMNQCYFVDINGCGIGVAESLIVGPQGEILASFGTEEKTVEIALDLDYVKDVREKGTEGVTLSWKHFIERNS